MPRTCCIINCTSRENDSRVKSTGNAFGFYRIPAWKRNSPSHVSEVTKRRRMAWIAAIRRPNITFKNTPPHMLVCSKHFHNGKPAYEMLECDPDWAPSLKLGHTEVKASTTARFDRLKQRSKSKQPRKGPRSSGAETAHAGEIHPVTTETTAESQPQQINPKHEDEDLQECKMCSQRLQEIAHLQEENLVLKKELSKKKLDMEFLKDENSKVKFYTGLPSFALLMGVLQQISPSLPDTDRKISQFQMLLLTLMRLRLNLPIAHIAHLFDISRTTTSTVFNITVNVLYAHLSPLVHWPGRHCIQASMPHQYVEMFGDRVTVIIDCFELFIERAQNLRAMAETYSTYKSRHTMKYLIGITPQGTISFISKGWGGRTSDKRIAETSGFLQKLSPGDIVLADRGFDIRESVALMGATLKIPAFTRGRSQLQAKDVEDTRKLAHVRIHVERVIGCLRSKYTILNDTIRLGFVVPCEGENMTLLDKIVAVSCALTNMCPSVVVKQASDE
ncbi:NADH dehydrogenase (ubiquinone) 1 alpha/beta subcomplex 1, acyl-carrier protein [Sarotherodon galilaeus]